MQNWLNHCCRTFKAPYTTLSSFPESCEQDRQMTVLKKSRWGYFLQDGNISSLLLVLTFKLELFFSFSIRKRANRVKKMENTWTLPFLREKLNGKNTGTAWLKFWLIYSYYDSNWLSTVIWVYRSCRNKAQPKLY